VNANNNGAKVDTKKKKNKEGDKVGNRSRTNEREEA
jgi:hypothetical protein